MRITNKVYLGDCLELMKEIDDKSIDMVLCDLPYGTTACHWDTIIPFEPLWKQYKRIIKDNGAIVLTASQPFTSALVMSNIKMFKYCWVWDKVLHSNPLIAKKQPLNSIEDIVVFYKNQCVYNPQMQDGDKTLIRSGNSVHLSETKGDIRHTISKNISGKRYPKRIITIPNTNRDGLHPTQKPVPLFEYFIKTYTNEGDLVLDNCAGSFTTAIACLNTKRDYICMEQEPKYFEIGKKRIEDWHKENNSKLLLCE